MAFKRTQHGFTLVEVMVALAIVAMALPALLGQVDSMANNTFNTRARTQAFWVAQNKFTEVSLDHRLNRVMPSKKDKDVVELAGQKWRWQLTTEETAVEGMYRMEIGVGRAEEDGTMVTLVGFIRE